MLEYYILDDDGMIVLEPDRFKWATWHSTEDTFITQTVIGDSSISTVFIGINIAFDRGIPLLFETMIFGGFYDHYQRRYVTRTGALEGHAEAVDLVKEHALDDD